MENGNSTIVNDNDHSDAQVTPASALKSVDNNNHHSGDNSVNDVNFSSNHLNKSTELSASAMTENDHQAKSSHYTKVNGSVVEHSKNELVDDSLDIELNQQVPDQSTDDPDDKLPSPGE